MNPFERLYLKMYRNLSQKLSKLLPKEMSPVVTILPSDKKNEDIVVVAVHVPHVMVKKLMWSFKAWRGVKED